MVSDRWQPGRSRDLGIGIGLHFELELHVGLVVLLVLVPVILGGELIVRVGLISSHSQTSGSERIVFYLLVENHDVGPELVYDDWAARVISPCLVVRPYRDDDIEWKRVRCGRAPSRLQLSGRSSCSSSS